MPIARVSFDDVLPSLPFAGKPGVAPGDVLALDALRRVAVCLDQVAASFNDQECRFGPGNADGPGSPANAGAFAEAERLVGVLELGAMAASAMVVRLRNAFPKPPAKPEPAPAPAPAKPEPAKPEPPKPAGK